jgi:hypothetical protein
VNRFLKNDICGTKIIGKGSCSEYSTCPNLCSGHGNCTNINICKCFTGYTGFDCSVAKLNLQYNQQKLKFPNYIFGKEVLIYQFEIVPATSSITVDLLAEKLSFEENTFLSSNGPYLFLNVTTPDNIMSIEEAKKNIRTKVESNLHGLKILNSGFSNFNVSKGKFFFFIKIFF